MKPSLHPDPRQPGLTGPFLRSVSVHALILLLLFFIGSQRSEVIQKREIDVLAKLEEKREEVIKTNEREAEELARETLKDELEEKLEAVLKDELEATDEADLLASMEESVEQTVEDLLGENEITEFSESDYSKLEQQAFTETFETVQRSLDDIRKEALLEEARREVRDNIAPKLKEEIENELAKQVSAPMANTLAKAIDEQRAERAKDVKEAITAARDEVRKLADAEKEVAKVAGEPEKAAAKQKEAEEALPAAEKALADAMEKAAEIGGDTAKKAKELAKKDTLSKPVEKASAGLANEDAKKAKSEVESAAKELDAKVKDLDKLAKDAESEGKKKDNLNTDAATATAALENAKDAIRDSVEASVRETGIPKATENLASKMASSLASAGWDAEEFKEAMAEAIGAELDSELSGEGAPDSGAVTAKAAESLSVATGGEEAKAATEALAATVGAEAAESAVADATAVAEEAAAAKTDGAVAKAVDSATRNAEISAEFKSRAARLANLEDKLEQVAKNVEDGRPATGAEPLAETETEEAATEAAEASTEATASAEESDGPSDGPSVDPAVAGSGPSAPPSVDGNSFGASYGKGYNSYAKMNREVYDRLKSFKDKRSSTDTKEMQTAAAKKAAEEAADTGVGRAFKGGAPTPGTIYVDALPTAEEAPRPEELVAPKFEALAFGGAEFQAKPLTIDGDLSDWGTLRHTMNMLWTFDGKPLENGLPLWVRWSPQGIYFAYKVPGRTKIDPSLEKPYEGDTFELWLDVDNLRKESMTDSPYSQQFLFMPWGNVRGREITFAEIGRGFRGINRHDYKFADPAAPIGRSAAKGPDANGYVVEGFLDRAALAKPRLKAGLYMAMNFSINRGYDYADSQQWSMSKSTETGGFDRPDTWGDVLLLGTDAETRFTEVGKPDGTPDAATPGKAMGIEITDADMNTDPAQPDRMIASVKIDGTSSHLSVILEETGPDTGIFRAAFNTQSSFQGASENTLNVRGGQVITLEYDDTRTATGTTGVSVNSRIPVALPVMTMAP